MAWTDTIFQWMGYGRYNASSPILIDGQPSELQVDPSGRLRVAVETSSPAGASALRSIPTAPGSGAVITSSSGKLLELLGHSQDSSDQYLMVFAASAIPSDGALPKQVFRIPASSPCISFTFYEVPVPYAGGLCWAISSTGDTLTRVSAANFWLEVVVALCPDT